MNAYKRYKLLRDFARLKNYEGRHTELISLYIPAEKDIFEIINRLKSEIQESSNIKSKENRKNVIDNITTIINRLKIYEGKLENGLCVFAGASECFLIEPPFKNRIYTYRCDNKFYLEELQKNLYTIEAVFGLIVLDSHDATVASLSGNSLKIIAEIESYIPGKTVKGGQSARRYQEIIKNEKNNFYKKVADVVNKYFKPIESEVISIFIGGIYPALDQFYERDDVYKSLRDKYKGPYTVGYTDEYGIKVLLKQIGEEMQSLMYSKQERLIEVLTTKILQKQATSDLEEIKRLANNRRITAIYLTKSRLNTIDNELIENILYNNPTIDLELFNEDNPSGIYLSKIGGFIVVSS